MISPSDEDYIETKRIKLGERELSPIFSELAKWIAEHYSGVTVLNVRYDKVEGRSKSLRPRLNVIFEWENDEKRFYSQDGMNYDPNQQAAIAAKFRSILRASRSSDFETTDLLVVYSAFERVARTEANWSVTNEQLAGLNRTLDHLGIWTVRPSWDAVTFFFYSDAQLKASVGAPVRSECSGAYARELSRFDEFGYFRVRPIETRFDSKENFDKVYHGNWFNYDRDN